MVLFKLFFVSLIGNIPVSKTKLYLAVLAGFLHNLKLTRNIVSPKNYHFKSLLIILVFTIFTGCADEISSEEDMLTMINTVRTTGYIFQGEEYSPVGLVNWDSQLEAAAIMQCNYMDSIGELSHYWKDGTGLKDRLLIVGYISEKASENISQGPKTEADALVAWLNSPPHCEVIMYGGYNIVAVSQKGNYWTMVLGVK